MVIRLTSRVRSSEPSSSQRRRVITAEFQNCASSLWDLVAFNMEVMLSMAAVR